MITTEDIKKLADLSRMELSGEEMETLTHEVDSILGYVGQIKTVNLDEAENKKEYVPTLHNVMREDTVTHEPRQYTEAILQNAPAREKDYLKVKKIL